MSIIEIKELNKSFGKQQVLKNVSLTIEEGEIMGLVGPNGAGKSTLINILLGLLKQDSGEVTLFGKSMTEHELAIKAQVGFVPQELALFEEATCYSNLLYFATLYNLYGKERAAACEEALELAGLLEERKKKVKLLSGGMKRRLNLVCATMHKPRILILDEPTVGIDPQSRNFIFEYLLRINRDEQCTLLYTTHYMEEIERLCDRLFILDKGEEVAFGDQASVRALVGGGQQVSVNLGIVPSAHLLEQITVLPGVLDLKVEDTYLSIQIAPQLFSLHALIQILESDNVNPLSIANEEISLEEVFLKLTGKELRA